MASAADRRATHDMAAPANGRMRAALLPDASHARSATIRAASERKRERP
jgi:hypothetical protein